MSTIALSFSRCAHQTVSDHAWYRPDPKQALAALTRLPSTDVFPVAEKKIGDAAERLRETAAIRITHADVTELLGRPLSTDADHVLVRGLCVGCGTGAFYVYVGDDRVIVDNVSLAPRNAVPRPWPLVVKLSYVPRDVYIQYSSAE
jgi:hypothetical protein